VNCTEPCLSIRLSIGSSLIQQVKVPKYINKVSAVYLFYVCASNKWRWHQFNWHYCNPGRLAEVSVWLTYKECIHQTIPFWMLCVSHRYIFKSRLLKFCFVHATSTCSSKGIFAVATNSTSKTSKAGGTCH